MIFLPFLSKRCTQVLSHISSFCDSWIGLLCQGTHVKKLFLGWYDLLFAYTPPISMAFMHSQRHGQGYMDHQQSKNQLEKKYLNCFCSVVYTHPPFNGCLCARTQNLLLAVLDRPMWQYSAMTVNEANLTKRQTKKWLKTGGGSSFCEKGPLW